MSQRNFFWPIKDRETDKELETLIRLSVVKGVHHTEVLAGLVREHNREFTASNPDVAKATLIDEKGLIQRLKADGIPVSRVTLLRHRTSSEFTRGDGSPYFWTDGRRIVYHLENCKRYFARRKTT